MQTEPSIFLGGPLDGALLSVYRFDTITHRILLGGRVSPIRHDYANDPTDPMIYRYTGAIVAPIETPAIDGGSGRTDAPA